MDARGSAVRSEGSSYARSYARPSGDDAEAAADFEDIAEPDVAAAEFEDAGDGDATRTKRFYLGIDDPVIQAPSIGSRTAARLEAIGIFTVRNLLDANAEDAASRLNTRFITAQRFADWQDQARLVCTIPWLRGTHAQLLVGAGHRTLDQIVSADVSQLCAAILRFAGTREGQSVLRAGSPPDVERIRKWVENSALAEIDRAA
jgi:hypothetical protein